MIASARHGIETPEAEATRKEHDPRVSDPNPYCHRWGVRTISTTKMRTLIVFEPLE